MATIFENPRVTGGGAGGGMAHPSRFERLRSMAAVPFLAAAMLFGGGAGPIVDGVIEFGGLLIAAIALAALRRPYPFGTRSAFAFLAFVALVVAVQLLPLPIAWPGHATADAIRDAAGIARSAAPLSLDPGATRRSVLSLLPAIGIFLALLPAPAVERQRVILVVAGVAAISMLLGMAQITTGGFYPYPTAHNLNPVGLFTNRNHQADLLIAGMVMAAILGRRAGQRPGLRLVAAAAMLVFAITVVTTISRAGTALMVPAFGAALLLLLPRRRYSPKLLIGGAIVLAVAAIAFVAAAPVLQATLARFTGSSSDLRMDYWKDTWVAIDAYWPAGSGIGTFVPVYAAAQDLGSVIPASVNHAHNDYLELLLECGIAAAVGIAAYLALIGRHAARLRHGALKPERTGALVILIVLLLHSLADYPLRMLTLITLFGAMSALLINPVRRA